MICIRRLSRLTGTALIPLVVLAVAGLSPAGNQITRMGSSSNSIYGN